MNRKKYMIMVMMLLLFGLYSCQSLKLDKEDTLRVNYATLLSTIQNAKQLTATMNATMIRTETSTFETKDYTFSTLINMDYDIENHFLYFTYNSIYQKSYNIVTTLDDQIVRYSKNQDVVSVLSYTPQAVLDLYSSTDQIDYPFVIISSTQNIYKTSEDNTFNSSIKIDELTSDERDKALSLLNFFEVDMENQDNLEFTCTYQLSLETQTMDFKLEIEDFLDTFYGVNISFSLETSLSIPSEIIPFDFSDDPLLIYGERSKEEVFYTLNLPFDSYVNPINRGDNFFKCYLDKGVYVIDTPSRVYDYSEITVYDQNGNIIPGFSSYYIEEPGNYYINIISNPGLGVYQERLYLYKVNANQVGVPGDLKATESETIVVEETTERSSFLLYEEAPRDGIIILELLNSTSPNMQIRSGAQDARLITDDFLGSHQFYSLHVKKGQPVIIDFDFNQSGKALEFQWNFYYQHTEDDNEPAQVIDLNQPNFCYFTNESKSAVFEFEITEAGYYQIHESGRYLDRIGNYMLDMYGIDVDYFTMDVYTDRVYLEPGHYGITYFGINGTDFVPSNMSRSDYAYILFSIKILKIN